MWCAPFYQALYLHHTEVQQYVIFTMLGAYYHILFWKMEPLGEIQDKKFLDWKHKYLYRYGLLRKAMACSVKKVNLMAKVNESPDGVEEGYESSRDEILSVSSYRPMMEDLSRTFGSSLSLQSFPARSSNRGSLYAEGRTSIASNVAVPGLSVAEVLNDSTADRLPPTLSPRQPPRHLKALSADDDSIVPSASVPVESGASEGFVRGRSYNIRLDDQVLLRFSPKNSESTYYFCDMIGGTLTFFHEEGARRCLELSITLEMTETINRNFLHYYSYYYQGLQRSP